MNKYTVALPFILIALGILVPWRILLAFSFGTIWTLACSFLWIWFFMNIGWLPK